MNEKRFDQKGSVYAKARPTYPDSLFAFLSERGVLCSESVVADIGAGTGIFTALIAPFAKTVYAVEPNIDMRKAAEQTLSPFSNTVLLSATAEHTALADTSCDLVTVAQAFHWFERSAFKAECRRILKPGGHVLLVWNDRDLSSEIIRDNFAVNRAFCPQFKGSSNGMDFSKENFSDFFEGEFLTEEHDNSLFYDRELFISRSLSSSYAPKPTDADYTAYVQAIGDVFDKYQQNGIVRYPYITRSYLGRV